MKKLTGMIVVMLVVCAQSVFAGRDLPTASTGNAPVGNDINTTVPGEEMLCRNPNNGNLLPVAFNTNGTRVAVPASWLNATLGTSYATNGAVGWRLDAIGDVDGNGQGEIIIRSNTQVRVLFFTDNGTVTIKNAGDFAHQPAPLTLATKWVIEGTGRFNKNPAAVYTFAGDPNVNANVLTHSDQMLIRNPLNGNMRVHYVDSTGAFVPYDANNTPMTPMTGISYMTNGGAGNWPVQAIGDVNGDGLDEIVIRQTNTNSVRILYFCDNGSNGRLKSDATQPAAASWTLATKWTIEGMGRFNTNPLSIYSATGSASTNRLGKQLLCRNPNNGNMLIAYIADNGSRIVQTNTSAATMPILGTSWATNAANWAVQSIGDVNGDGQDEIILRNTAASAVVSNQSPTRVLFLGDNSSNLGQLKAVQPASFMLGTKWTVEGFKKGKK